MNEPTLTCPSCKAEIKLTESLAAPLVESTRNLYEQKLSQKDKEISKREAAISAQKEEIEKTKASIKEQLEAKLKVEREKIAVEEQKKARMALSMDLEQKSKLVGELEVVLKEKDAKLLQAQKAQAELIRKQRQLDDTIREAELTIEKKVQESLGTVREKAKKEAEEEQKLKVLEKEKTITAMQQQIEDLKRRSEQGSQQLQGEILELELENLLRNRFPTDNIEPVPKGEFGGDILHRVINQQGQSCGTILWETKRTKNWSDGWLSKLRGDQRAAKADIALIISQALPKGTETFEFLEGVWIADPKYIIPISLVLRYSLIELAQARQAGEGQQTKTELMYQYLTGSRFRHRVEAIVEKFSDMKEDLDKERKMMSKAWAKREEQINCVMNSVAGMYGEMQGIAGKTLKEIEGLALSLEAEDTIRPLLLSDAS